MICLQQNPFFFSFWTAHTHFVAHKKVYDKKKFKYQLTQAYTHLERAAIYSAEFISQQYI